MERKAYCD